MKDNDEEKIEIPKFRVNFNRLYREFNVQILDHYWEVDDKEELIDELTMTAYDIYDEYVSNSKNKRVSIDQSTIDKIHKKIEEILTEKAKQEHIRKKPIL